MKRQFLAAIALAAVIAGTAACSSSSGEDDVIVMSDENKPEPEDTNTLPTNIAPTDANDGTDNDANGDSDGDSVLNDADACPTTKAGEPVDEKGCFEGEEPNVIDTDVDGVADASDKCPDTMKGWAVDGEGCAIIYTFVPPANDFIYVNFNQAPTVTSAAPGYGANAYPTDWPIVIQFDQPMDVESVKAHVKLEVFALFIMGDVPLQFVGESGGHKTFTFKPLKPLKADWAYNVVIEKGVKGDKGTTTEDITWGFTTKK